MVSIYGKECLIRDLFMYSVLQVIDVKDDKALYVSISQNHISKHGLISRVTDETVAYGDIKSLGD